jgi:hypothetical protein
MYFQYDGFGGGKMVQSNAKDKKKRFTLDMSAELQTRIKIAAASEGVTMREYTLSAIEHRLNRDQIRTLVPGRFSLKTIQEARDMKKQIFGKRRLPEESVVLIHQSREERISELE